jgi:FkbM family methyltransferase
LDVDMHGGLTKQLGRRLLSPFLGRRRFQGFFQDVYEVALAGLNYGEGANPAASGERRVIEYVIGRLGGARTMTVFDVGANVGEYAASLLELSGDRTRIYCFEPASGTFRTLSEALEGRPGVTLENCGLGDADTEATLYSLGDGSKLASLYERRIEHAGVHLDHKETIRLLTLDGYCAQHGIDAIDLLKMDVEGHEMSVMRGARRMLEGGHIRFLQFEFSAANIDSRTFFRDFHQILSPKYNLYRVLRDGLLPVERYHETQEVFKRATNYLAERRS